jgi:myb proto-oncogene protein
MGIDPVTHAPRLDLLDISSIISSSLCNPSLLNMSNFLGTQALMNPELLKLATAILSLKQQNQMPFSKDLQDQLCNSLLQDQVQQPLQHNQYQQGVSSGMITNQLLMQANMETFANSQENSTPSSLNDGFVSQQPNNNMYCSSNPTVPHDLPENLNFQSLYNSNQNFSFDQSVVSTPMSSPTPLNSPSTFINSSTEDERESYSYCSDLLMFEIPESLDLDEFM